MNQYSSTTSWEVVICNCGRIHAINPDIAHYKVNCVCGQTIHKPFNNLIISNGITFILTDKDGNKITSTEYCENRYTSTNNSKDYTISFNEVKTSLSTQYGKNNINSILNSLLGRKIPLKRWFRSLRWKE